MRKAVIFFIVILGLQACKKGTEDIDPPQISNGAALYFKGEVNGKDVLFEAGKEGYFQGHSWGGIDVPVWASHFVTQDANSDAIGFFFACHSKMLSSNPEEDLAKTLVAGGKNYVNAMAGIKENEVFISYKRKAFPYESALINQNSLTFNIESVKDTIFQGRKFLIAQIAFDAQLFSSINNDTLQIRNGQARIAYLASP